MAVRPQQTSGRLMQGRKSLGSQFAKNSAATGMSNLKSQAANQPVLSPVAPVAPATPASAPSSVMNQSAQRGTALASGALIDPSGVSAPNSPFLAGPGMTSLQTAVGNTKGNFSAPSLPADFPTVPFEFTHFGGKYAPFDQNKFNSWYGGLNKTQQAQWDAYTIGIEIS